MGAMPAFELLDPQVVDDPYPFYAHLLEHSPLYEVPGTDVRLVARGDLIEEVLARHEEFSSNLTGVIVTGPTGAPEVFDMTRFGGAVDAIANADEPSHGLHRSLLLPYVTPRAVASLEEELRSWTVELIEPWLEAGGGDWIDAVANPLPTRAMARAVGLPLEDADRLLVWAMRGTEILAGTTTLERMGEVGAATAELVAYLGKQLQGALAACDTEPAADMIGSLARAVREGALAERDAVSILVVLAGAGGESTSSMTGNAARILAEQEALQEQLRADPSLIPAFVEEVVRTETPFRGHYRAVKRETQLAGETLPAGSHLLLLWAAANRDPEVFPRPERIDLQRPNLRAHLGFGKGLHFCAGARLARLEGRVILEELLGRTRSLRLDERRPPEYVPSIFVRRHAHLDLRTES